MLDLRCVGSCALIGRSHDKEDMVTEEEIMHLCGGREVRRILYDDMCEILDLDNYCL